MADRSAENAALADDSASGPDDVTETTQDAAAPDLGPVPALPGLDSPLSLTENGPGLVFPLLMALKKHVVPLGKESDFRVERKGVTKTLYKFRGIDDVYNHLHRLLGEFGLLLVPRETTEVKRAVFERPGQFDGQAPTRSNHVALMVRYEWIASDGSSLSVEVPGEGMDPGDKGTGKALSMAHKYAIVQSLGLPTGEPDGDDFLTEGVPAADRAGTHPPARSEPRPSRAAPGDQGGPAPSAPLDTPGRAPFRDAQEAHAVIKSIKTPSEYSGVRRRIFDSVNAQKITGGEANTVMAALDERVKGLRE